MRLIALATICALASCNQIPAPAETDQDVDMSGAMTMLPGMYEASSDMQIIDIPGLDEDDKQAMRDRAARMTRQCIEKDDLADAETTFFRGPFNDCAYAHMTMKEGRIDGLMRCANGDSRSELAIGGTYHAAGYQMTIDMQTEGPRGRMQWTQRAQRVADCP